MEIIVGADDIDAETAEPWGWFNRSFPPPRHYRMGNASRLIHAVPVQSNRVDAPLLASSEFA